MTGMTKNVAIVHAKFARPPTSDETSWPAPSRSSACRALMAAPTTSCTPAQLRIGPKCPRAAAQPSLALVSTPSSERAAQAVSATLQNTVTTMTR